MRRSFLVVVRGCSVGFIALFMVTSSGSWLKNSIGRSKKNRYRISVSKIRIYLGKNQIEFLNDLRIPVLKIELEMDV